MHQLSIILGATLAVALVFLSGYLASRARRRGRPTDGGSAGWLFVEAHGSSGHGHCDAGGHSAGCDGGAASH